MRPHWGHWGSYFGLRRSWKWPRSKWKKSEAKILKSPIFDLQKRNIPQKKVCIFAKLFAKLLVQYEISWYKINSKFSLTFWICKLKSNWKKKLQDWSTWVCWHVKIIAMILIMFRLVSNSQCLDFVYFHCKRTVMPV